MIIKSDELIFEAHNNGYKIWLTIHNNAELPLIHYEELTIDINNNQAKELIAWLQENIKWT